MRYATLMCAGVLLVAMDAEAGRRGRSKDTVSVPTQDLSTASDWLSVNEGLFIRAGFDTDPSDYIGRFVKAGTAVPAETSAMELSCSRYITHREVGGGGVVYDEYFRADSAAATRLSVPPAFRGSAEADRSMVMRVRYTLTNKMRYVLEDAEGFEACCRKAPDQCTDVFVGEFLEGTGEVFYTVGTAAEVDAQGLTPGVMAELQAKDGRYWKAARTFPAPVYFAFLTADNIHAPLSLPSGSCDDVTWDDEIPGSSQGQYFVGISQYRPTEQEARAEARRDAKAQAVQWLSEDIQTSWSEDTTRHSGTSPHAHQSDSLTMASAAVAEHIKDEAWCTDVSETPTGDRYRVKVAMFFPNAYATGS